VKKDEGLPAGNSDIFSLADHLFSFFRRV